MLSHPAPGPAPATSTAAPRSRPGSGRPAARRSRSRAAVSMASRARRVRASNHGGSWVCSDRKRSISASRSALADALRQPVDERVHDDPLDLLLAAAARALRDVRALRAARTGSGSPPPMATPSPAHRRGTGGSHRWTGRPARTSPADARRQRRLPPAGPAGRRPARAVRSGTDGSVTTRRSSAIRSVRCRPRRCDAVQLGRPTGGQVVVRPGQFVQEPGRNRVLVGNGGGDQPPSGPGGRDVEQPAFLLQPPRMPSSTATGRPAAASSTSSVPSRLGRASEAPASGPR